MTENNQLSERELEILRLVATGASNKDIAKQLVISINTVKVHLRNIFSKLGVSSRTEATIYAVQMGIVQPRLSGSAGETDASILETELRSTGDFWTKYRWLWLMTLIAAILLMIIVIYMEWNDEPLPVSAPETIPLQDESRWQEHTRMQMPRKGFAGTVYDDQIYIIAGETTDGITNLVERYDSEDETWEILQSKNTPVTDISADAIGGLIYVPGGRFESGEVTDKLEVFNPLDGQWYSRSPMPMPLSAYALIAFEGKLYIFGGWNGNVYVGNVYVYDPSQDRWEEKTSMPTARGYAGAAVSSGKIFVFGGTNGDVLDVNEAYQPSLDDGDGTPWEVRAPLPEKRYGMGTASVADIIHVFGGEGLQGESHPDGNLAWKYFPKNDVWEEFLVPNNQTWVYLKAVPLGTQIFTLGGELEGKTSDINASYQAIFTVTIPVVR